MGVETTNKSTRDAVSIVSVMTSYNALSAAECVISGLDTPLIDVHDLRQICATFQAADSEIVGLEIKAQKRALSRARRAHTSDGAPVTIAGFKTCYVECPEMTPELVREYR